MVPVGKLSAPRLLHVFCPEIASLSFCRLKSRSEMLPLFDGLHFIFIFISPFLSVEFHNFVSDSCSENGVNAFAVSLSLV
jgi:hypothetical protein